MTNTTQTNPFHAGERAAQARAGVGDVSQWAGGFVRDYLPDQHRAFHSSLPFLAIASSDGAGRTWVTLVEGEDGFVRSPDPHSLTMQTTLPSDDPLVGRLATGGEIGVVGIELGTRRRNRFSGRIRPKANGYIIDIGQTFGNCPQYIHERSWRRVPVAKRPPSETSDRLSEDQVSRIRAADTLFIGSGQFADRPGPANGYDASHRGGAPGFVNVRDGQHLQIPDYAGNNFFNTIGNITSDPRVGLLFVDFETGGLLHVTGRADIDWSPRNSHDPDAWRMINVEIDAVIDRPAAVSLRWSRLDHLSRKLRLARREAETGSIASFYFTPANGRPLDPFLSGQHLPVSVQIPGQAGQSKRSYSLSGATTDTEQYRLSIKREEHGLVSRFLHGELRVGDVIETQQPSGDFVIPNGIGPVVLASAGVGLTPMVSMLHELAQGQRPTWFVHGARNGRNHALRDDVTALLTQHPHLRQRVFYSQPDADDLARCDSSVTGRITAPDLIGLQAGPDTRYMLCGPSRFLADLRTGLEDLGVPADHIYFETFGSTG